MRRVLLTMPRAILMGAPLRHALQMACGLLLTVALPVAMLPAVTIAQTSKKAASRKTAPAAKSAKKAKAAVKPAAAVRARTVRSPLARRGSAAPTAPGLRFTAPRTADALTSDLGALLSSRTRGGTWGAMVVSLTRGDTLFANQADRPLVPASTMKLFTSAVAFDRLGPEHLFSTDVLRDGPLEAGGVVRGNLVLRGDGDPSMTPRFVRGGPDASMQLLAQLTAGAGITRVTGDLIADASAFETRRIPDGWLRRYAGAGYAAPFGALSLNENILVVGVSPDGNGGAAAVTLEPAMRGMTVVNTARVVAGSGARLSIRMLGDDHIQVSGTVGARGGTRRYQLVVGDPALFTAGAFRAALEARGIRVDGEIQLGRAPATSVVMARLPSPPLARIISAMNRESINHFAELLWRDAARGADRSAVGSADNASATLRDFLVSKVGTTADAVTATDGSGLSVLDRVTPRALVQLLSHANTASWGSAFHASLPVAGESELLRHRMRQTPAQGNLHAKTGTTNDVVGLSGYVTAENGEILAFAFLYNGPDRWHARETIDVM
ncbi:MAG: D-alanyl-D-alanine carboxypeptidase/D-alanyl-D-alanine-endopeptidase, partial [Gemmatimonadaceae bacterium]